MRFYSVVACGVIQLAALGAIDAQPLSPGDSAASARSAYQRARVALQSGNVRDARNSLLEAYRAWPNTAYLVGSAQLAARDGDASSLADFLRQLAQFESGAAVLQDSAVMAMVSMHRRVADAADLLTRAILPVARGNTLAAYTDSTLFPEAVDQHPATRALYITSVRHGTVTERTTSGTERTVWSSRVGGAAMAVRVDRDGRHLWVTTTMLPQRDGMTSADSNAYLIHVRIADGVEQQRWVLGRASSAVPGDIATAGNGDVYVSNSAAPVIFVLRKGSSSLEKITSPLFRSLQGMALSENERLLFVADYSHGLLRVDLSSGVTARIAHGPHVNTLGFDGIALVRNTIVAVQNGQQPARIVRMELNDAGTTVLSMRTIDRDPQVADEPTNGFIDGNDFVYVANSQWEKYDGEGKRLNYGKLRAPIIRTVPIW